MLMQNENKVDRRKKISRQLMKIKQVLTYKILQGPVQLKWCPKEQLLAQGQYDIVLLRAASLPRGKASADWLLTS